MSLSTSRNAEQALSGGEARPLAAGSAVEPKSENSKQQCDDQVAPVQFTLSDGNFAGANIGAHNYQVTHQDGFVGSDLRNANFGTQNVHTVQNIYITQSGGDGYSTTESKESEYDEKSDGKRLSDTIRIFPDKKLSRSGNVFEGVLLSKVCGPKPVAIKFCSYSEENVREAKILEKLSRHENVVAIIHADVHSQDVMPYMYLAMERCHTKNLHQYVIENKENEVAFDEATGLIQAMQVARGVDFIHRNDIIHRDLKPDNILLSLDEKTLKIADFGLSKELRRGCSVTTQSDVRVGTDGYRAPETYNSNEISQRSDIFSLGLVIFFIWSNGEHPFGDDPDDWNGNIKRNKNRDLSNLLISDIGAAQHILDKMLAFKPKSRPTAVDLLEELTKLRQSSESLSVKKANTATRRRTIIRLPYGFAQFILFRSEEFSTKACREMAITCELTEERGGGIFIEGEAKKFNDAMQAIKSLERRIVDKEHTLHGHGIKEYYQSKLGRSYLMDLEKKYNCVILMESKDWTQNQSQIGHLNAAPEAVSLH